MTSRGWRRALAFAAAVAVVAAGASYFNLRDESPAAVVGRASVSAAKPPAANAVPAVVADGALVQQPIEPEDGASTDADTWAVPEVAGDFPEPAQVSPAVPASYVQQPDGTYVDDGGLRTLVHTNQDAADADAGLEVPVQAYPEAVGPHVEIGDSPLTAAPGDSAAIQQVPTVGTAPAPERLRSGARPEAPQVLPATAR